VSLPGKLKLLTEVYSRPVLTLCSSNFSCSRGRRCMEVDKAGTCTATNMYPNQDFIRPDSNFRVICTANIHWYFFPGYSKYLHPREHISQMFFLQTSCHHSTIPTFSLILFKRALWVLARLNRGMPISVVRLVKPMTIPMEEHGRIETIWHTKVCLRTSTRVRLSVKSRCS